MAWIESHQQLGRHPKTKRLARLLGISLPAAVGHLHYLWWWALDYAEDGDLSAYDASDIADAALWEGDPDAFVRALLECGPGEQAGFLEHTADNRLILHDWIEYVGELLELREQRSKAGARGNHERWHVARGIFVPECPYCAESPESLSGAESQPSQTDRTAIAQRSQPDRKSSHQTKPNLTQPNQTVEDNTRASKPESTPPPYDEIVRLYHELCPSLPSIRGLTDKRKAAIRSRWQEYKSLDVFRELFQLAEASDFLSGRNGKWTSCNFDWLLRPTNMPKVLEGTYNRGGPTRASPLPESPLRRRMRERGRIP